MFWVRNSFIADSLYAFIYFKTESRFNKNTVAVETITIPTDPASIALGEHIAAIKGCGDCHGKDYGGNVVIDDPGLRLGAGAQYNHG